jgi:hypothetical protein
MFYSSGKGVKREAFLPAPEKTDVSLLRHRYTDDHFCKNHSVSLKVGDNNYCGMATFHCCHISEIIQETSDSDKTHVVLNGTPIDENNNYINIPPVFVDSPGLPMHADLIYDTPTQRGVPNTKHRQFASKLAKLSNYFDDPSPATINWSGLQLTWVKK